MSTTKLRLVKTDSEFIEVAGAMVETESGRRFYHLPYWYEKVGEDMYVEYGFNDLPKELAEELTKQRNS